MLSGTPQSIATLRTILLFYTMDFVLIRRYDKKRRASGSGRSWDFTFFIFVTVAALFATVHDTPSAQHLPSAQYQAADVH